MNVECFPFHALSLQSRMWSPKHLTATTTAVLPAAATKVGCRRSLHCGRQHWLHCEAAAPCKCGFVSYELDSTLPNQPNHACLPLLPPP